MEPTKYVAEQDGDQSWTVCGRSGSSSWSVASGISSGETAREIAGLLQLNLFSADAIESGNVAIVLRRLPRETQADA